MWANSENLAAESEAQFDLVNTALCQRLSPRIVDNINNITSNRRSAGKRGGALRRRRYLSLSSAPASAPSKAMHASTHTREHAEDGPCDPSQRGSIQIESADAGVGQDLFLTFSVPGPH